MPDPARVVLPGLLAGGWRGLPFVPFRAGIEIHRIYGDGIVGPAAAVLRYRPGAGVPWHEHRGSEQVVVLEGSQEDERGSYPAGTLAINPPGSRHSVRSRGGCVALLIWEQPVRFIAPQSEPYAGPEEPLSTTSCHPAHRPITPIGRPSCVRQGKSLHPA